MYHFNMRKHCNDFSPVSSQHDDTTQRRVKNESYTISHARKYVQRHVVDEVNPLHETIRLVQSVGREI